MRRNLDPSGSYFLCDAFKFDSKDVELNPAITEANVNVFLTFPRARISLTINTFFFYRANKSGIPL